ncbi:MAG TPA: ferric reductase-like transmembrane domain-containing protein [Acidimicrobiia bacterium]|nr:ferric reductase-like transmembrane domain-containing protein [Acidimicrobiia bacterium]
MNLTWITVRGSGIIAFALLAAATIWGLVISSKTLSRAVSTKNTTYVHEAFSIGSLFATVIHVVALLTDEYVDFGLRQVLVPGASPWKPVAIALGIVALYGMVLTSFTFYIRQRIGQRVWRGVHYLTYGVFSAALIHSIQAGTDSHGIFAFALYGGTTLVIVTFTILRVLTYGTKPARSAKTPATNEAAAT